MNLVLLQQGYAVTNISGESQHRLVYYDALEKCNLEQDKAEFFVLIAGLCGLVWRSLLGFLGIPVINHRGINGCPSGTKKPGA
jgi:hypothetical protein